MKLPDKVYNFLKWTCLIALPAFSVAYFGLAKIWGLPYEAEIPATLDVLAVLIGSLIRVSQYNIDKENKDASL